MKLHPRYYIVNKARFEIDDAVWDIMGRSALTYLETMQILNGLTERLCMYAIRHERHPDDPDKKGDEE